MQCRLRGRTRILKLSWPGPPRRPPDLETPRPPTCPTVPSSIALRHSTCLLAECVIHVHPNHRTTLQACGYFARVITTESAVPAAPPPCSGFLVSLLPDGPTLYTHNAHSHYWAAPQTSEPSTWGARGEIVTKWIAENNTGVAPPVNLYFRPTYSLAARCSLCTI